MQETRAQLKERLQREGKWANYLAGRERLKAEGFPPEQARTEALRQVDSVPQCPSEPPVPVGTVDPPAAAGPDPTPVAEEPGVDFNREASNFESAQWVASNIANLGVRAQDAPSGLAWGLLQWVRLHPANQTAFWSSIWPKLLPTGTALQRHQEEEKVERKDVGTEKVKKLLEELIGQQEAEQAREDALLAARPDAAQIAGTLQKRLEGALAREERLRKRLEELERGNP
jgi:hypothetical protein